PAGDAQPPGSAWRGEPAPYIVPRGGAAGLAFPGRAWERGPAVLREEQIDIRRQRAVEGKFTIKNLGRNRVFSDYQVVNPATGGQYQVSIRGFEVGDNTCTCPDYRTNTLGTCKHVEAVLTTLRDEAPVSLRKRKAKVIRPEVQLHYGEQLTLALHLPEHTSDQLRALAGRFFDAKGLWKESGRFEDFIEAVHTVP